MNGTARALGPTDTVLARSEAGGPMRARGYRGPGATRGEADDTFAALRRAFGRVDGGARQAHRTPGYRPFVSPAPVLTGLMTDRGEQARRPAMRKKSCRPVFQRHLNGTRRAAGPAADRMTSRATV